MIGRTDISDKLAFDSKGLDELRHSSKSNSPESLKEAAKQFEALFVNMMLKSMRQASSQDGMFDNEQSKLYTSMLDQQLSQKMASRGVGLADAMIRQLSNNQMSQALNADNPQGNVQESSNLIDQYLFQDKSSDKVSKSFFEPNDQIGMNANAPKHVQEFTQKLAEHAEAASSVSGIPAKFMLGQAALESGWGKKEIKAMDGSTSHNVFGIKATGQWKGKTVDTLTTEYSNGVAYQKVEKFRAYDNYADAFKDYAKLLTENPRYQNVIQHSNDPSRFALELQKAGYATDPQYAQKINNIIKHSLSI
jgi:flagellar protein FlgJ